MILSWVLIAQFAVLCIIFVVALMFSLRVIYFSKNDRDPINTAKPWPVELFEKDEGYKRMMENG